MQFMERKDAMVFRNDIIIRAFENLKEKHSAKELSRIVKLRKSNNYDHEKQ